MKPIPQTLRLGDQGDMVKAVQYLVGVPAYGKLPQEQVKNLQLSLIEKEVESE